MSNAGCKPNAKRPMYVATTEAMPSGMSVRELAAGSMSSTAKTMPPIGVLNVAAMPPAPPQAMSVIRCGMLQPDATPTIDPTAAHGVLLSVWQEGRGDKGGRGLRTGGSDLDDGTFAADGAPRADGEAGVRGSRWCRCHARSSRK